jgi:hypothetical protein
MKFNVHMLAFKGHGGKDFGIRVVDVPDDKLTGTLEDLEAIFHYGQNDFQNKPLPSVSVGDVVELDGEYHIVKGSGWKKLTTNQFESFLKMKDQKRQEFVFSLMFE